jgi:hypothetical protein
MKRILSLGIIAMISLGFTGSVCAEEFTYSHKHLSLYRDTTYEQFLHFQASPDTAITPARVLRWINSLMGYTQTPSASNVEIQPIVRANNFQKQFIFQIAYTF